MDGGTLNPVHVGHLNLVPAALEHLLDHGVEGGGGSVSA